MLVVLHMCVRSRVVRCGVAGRACGRDDHDLSSSPYLRSRSFMMLTAPDLYPPPNIA